MKHERIYARAAGGSLQSCSACKWERWARDPKTLDKYWTAHLPKEKEKEKT